MAISKFLKVVLLTVTITMNSVAMLKGLLIRTVNEHKLPARTVKPACCDVEVQPATMPTFLRF